MKSASLFALLGAGGLALAQGSNSTANSTASSSASSTASSPTSLPTVDLGYQIQQASGYNATGAYYNFSNIRYAAPPIGDLRFELPQDPAQNRSVVQNGQDARICPQASIAWESIAEQFVPEYLTGTTTFNTSSFTQPNFTFPVQDPTTNEDCLFLDVFVPEDIWNQRNTPRKFPVLFWIYGGGFAFGSKISSGSPSGLLERSMNNTYDGGVIYVAPNYRLGAFGWMGGPSYQSEGGVANLGLYDQRRALDWVQKHIHSFGGDKDRVTVFGESAGGSSILHQITAFGGLKGPAPFKQAVLQSPAFLPIPSLNQQENIYQTFLSSANVSNLAEARNLSYTQLQYANVISTYYAPYGTFLYGPMVDGYITPALPGQLLARGQFDHDLTLMIGQNADEGLEFTSPYVSTANETELEEIVYASIPTLRGLPNETDYVFNTLYPAVYNGSYSYTNAIGRAALITAEFAFICNTFYLDKAFQNQTWSYLFNVFPALHGFDVPYTYYTGTNQTQSGVSSPYVALAMQDYITQFAEGGSPNGPDGVPFFQYSGANASVLELNATSLGEAMDPAANLRCNYWQSGVWS